MKKVYDQPLREEARKLAKEGFSHRTIAKRLGIAPGSVDNVLKVDLAPPKVDEATRKRARDMATSLSWTAPKRKPA